MHARKLLIAAALLAACSDEPTGPSISPARITISAPFTVLIVGGDLQLSATVYDALNKPIATASVSWESLTPTIASVSQTGLVTGLAVGQASIRATSGSYSAVVELTVDPDPCVTPLVLGVGEVKVLSGPAAVACITLAPIATAADLLFVTANVAQQQDQVGNYQVSVPPDLEVSLPAIAAPADLRMLTELAAVRYSDHLEASIRSKERDLLRVTKPALRAAGLRGAETSIAVAPANAVGDIISYRVPDIHAQNLCTTYTTIQARVKVIGQRAMIVEDLARPAGGFTDADYAAIAAEFDNIIYRTDTLYFGRETDRNNDQLITILYTPEVNKATAPNSLGFIAGFFWGGDLVLPNEYVSAGVHCPQTNGQELFYLMVPDPQGTINNNERTIEVVRQNTRGTIAHELQHMINQGVRLFDPAVDSTETPWLNEALSHMAEEMVGRALRGFGDYQTLTWNDVNPTPGQQDDYDAFFRQNFARLRLWMQAPDTAAPVSNKARNQLAPRGAGWMFLRYVLDHYANNNAKLFLRNLVRGPDIGVRNLLQHAAGAQFDALVRGFLVSQYVSGLGVPGIDQRYEMRSWNVRDAITNYNSGTFPLVVKGLPGAITTKSLSSSGNYFRLTTTDPLPETTFSMTAPSGGPVAFGAPQVYVVRIN